MAKKLYLDKKSLVAVKPLGGGVANPGIPTSSLTNVENYVDLKEYIGEVAPAFTLPNTIVLDEIVGYSDSLTLNKLFIYKGNTIVVNRVPVVKNVTGTLSATDLFTGYITSTSAAAVSLTTPTTNAIRNFYGQFDKATFEFTIDNLLGANDVTIVLDSGWSVITPAIIGQDDLVVPAGELGIFKVISISASVCKIIRIA